MASNEARAKLIGCSRYWGARFDGPFFDISLDACAELRAFVQRRKRNGAFINELRRQIIGSEGHVTWWMILNATPQQFCAAFDATFAKELAELESKHAK